MYEIAECLFDVGVLQVEGHVLQPENGTVGGTNNHPIEIVGRHRGSVGVRQILLDQRQFQFIKTGLFQSSSFHTE